jgi:hypothetical protein
VSDPLGGFCNICSELEQKGQTWTFQGIKVTHESPFPIRNTVEVSVTQNEHFDG